VPVFLCFVPFRDDFVAAPREHFAAVFRAGLPPHSLSLSLLPPSAALNRATPLVAALSRAGLISIHFGPFRDDFRDLEIGHRESDILKLGSSFQFSK
jgi:hypothetical protein